MKRFVLFGGPVYYAAGGFSDFVGSFDTVDEARHVAETKICEVISPELECEWWHIFDMVEHKIVGKSEYQGYGASNDGPSLDEK